jgi:RsiW-degrading membrane proteinase PrsW (M82 family)
MNDTAPLQFQHGIPPLPSLIAVLVCAALMVTLYQKLFPRPARWYLVAVALALGGAVTGLLVVLLTPAGERLMEISDLWSALRIVVLTVGLPEEGVKALAALATLLIFHYSRRDATPFEAFQVALFAALGFAIVENALYAKAFEGASLIIAGGRGIFASFIHSLMMMIQGTFLMRFVATGWRRWHLPIIGWLLAAAAHAGFDWGMLRPLTYALTKSGDPMAMQAVVLESLPVLIIGIPAPFVIGLWLFRGALRQAGDLEREQLLAIHGPLNADATVGYQNKLRPWRRAGNALLILGAIGLVASIGVAIYVAASTTMPLPPDNAPIVNGTPDLSAEMKSSVMVTAALIASPAVMLLGLLSRWKR